MKEPECVHHSNKYLPGKLNLFLKKIKFVLKTMAKLSPNVKMIAFHVGSMCNTFGRIFQSTFIQLKLQSTAGPDKGKPQHKLNPCSISAPSEFQ